MNPLLGLLATLMFPAGVVVGGWIENNAEPPACGATGPLVAMLREVDSDVACTLTGTIMNARIELVEGE